MKSSTFVYVWTYLVVATLAEVFLFYTVPGGSLVSTSIGILAASKAVLIAMYFMHLRYEPRPLRFLVFPPAVLVTVLVLTLVFSFAH